MIINKIFGDMTISTCPKCLNIKPFVTKYSLIKCKCGYYGGQTMTKKVWKGTRIIVTKSELMKGVPVIPLSMTTSIKEPLFISIPGVTSTPMGLELKNWVPFFERVINKMKK